MIKQMAGSGEDRLIDEFFRPLAKDPGAFSLTDDAAVITPPAGADVVLKTDPIICGVHFLPDDPADCVAQKALRVNLSDLAAKGAKPAGFLMALALPSDTPHEWVAKFARGLAADAETYNCPLLGGDTDDTPGPLTISVAAFGTLPHGSMLRRSGARAGETIVVTGTIGDAALGLILRSDPQAAKRWHLTDRQRDHLLGRYLLPQPRSFLAETLRTHASGAMDVSDGLAGDLTKLCIASRVAADIEVARIPFSDAVKSALSIEPGLIETLLTGGDDYEIICTINTDRLASFRVAAAAASISVASIGQIVGGQGAHFINSDGRPRTFTRSSYSHF